MRPAPGDIPLETVGPPAAWEDRGRRLLLPAGLPGGVTRAFALAAHARLEAGALLYGTRGSGDGAATASTAW